MERVHNRLPHSRYPDVFFLKFPIYQRVFRCIPIPPCNLVTYDDKKSNTFQSLPVMSPNFRVGNRVFFVESFQTQKLFKVVRGQRAYFKSRIPSYKDFISRIPRHKLRKSHILREILFPNLALYLFNIPLPDRKIH